MWNSHINLQLGKSLCMNLKPRFNDCHLWTWRCPDRRPLFHFTRLGNSERWVSSENSFWSRFEDRIQGIDFELDYFRAEGAFSMRWLHVLGILGRVLIRRSDWASSRNYCEKEFSIIGIKLADSSWESRALSIDYRSWWGSTPFWGRTTVHPDVFRLIF